MSYKARGILIITLIILFVFVVVTGIYLSEPALATTNNNCQVVGSIGNVLYSLCTDPETNVQFIGNNAGYFEVIQ